MDIITEKLNTANAVVKATISNEDIDKNIQKLAKELSKTADVAGFRKGKVPLDVIKKQYGEKLKEDAQGQAIRDVLDTALKQMDISPEAVIGEPQMEKLDKTDSGLDVEIKISLRPDIVLGDYEKLIDEIELPDISEEAMNKRLLELAKAQTPLEDIKEDRGLAEGDTAIIDFEGFLDDVAFDGGKAENYALEIGSNQFIPGFESQLIGLKKGESKEIEVTFPQDYGQENLAGKPVKFKIKLNAIQARGEIVISEEIAKKMAPNDDTMTLDKLKDQLKLQLENEALNKLYNDKLKPELLEKLVDNIDFDLPDFVIEQEMDVALNKKAQTMTKEEIDELKDNDEKVLEIRETFRDDATRSVKATFLIDALAKVKSVNVSEQEIMQTLYYEAVQMGREPQEHYEQYQKSGYLPAVQMAMIEDRVLTKLLNEKVKRD